MQALGSLNDRAWRVPLRWLVIVSLPLAVLVGVAYAASWLTTQHEIVVNERATAPQVQSANGPEEAFAARFATAYLSYQSGQTQQYRSALQPYLASNVDPGQLWDGNGTSTVQEALPVSVKALSTNVDRVTVAVLLSGQPPQWEYLGIPVHQDQSGFVVVDPPSLLPAPGQAQWQAPTSSMDDPALSASLKGNMAAFFTAYADSDWAQLGYYTSPGASIGGLAGAVKFVQLDQLQVDAGAGDQRTATATVTWQAGNAHLQQQYRLTLNDQTGKWLVSNLTPAGGD